MSPTSARCRDIHIMQTMESPPKMILCAQVSTQDLKAVPRHPGVSLGWRYSHQYGIERHGTYPLCSETFWSKSALKLTNRHVQFILPSCKSKSSQSFHRPIIPFPWINLLNIGWTHSPVSLNPPPPNLPTGNSTNPGSLNALGSRIVSPTRVDFEMETLFIPLYSRLFCCAVLDL